MFQKSTHISQKLSTLVTFFAIKTLVMLFQFMCFQDIFIRKMLPAMETAVVLEPLEHARPAGVAKVMRVR